MVVTAAQIKAMLQAEQGRRANAVRTTGKRVYRRDQPCREADKGCTGRTGGSNKRTAHGWCANCYGRWYKFGDPWGHAPNLVNCRGKNCRHPEVQPKREKKMPVHTDSRSGQQFHIRYTPKNGDTGPYWTSVYETRDRAEQELKWYLKNGYTDAKVFVREVAPWREL